MDHSIIEAGQTLLIQVKRGENETEFPTTVVDRFDNSVVVEPVLYEGKMVNFNIPGIGKKISLFHEPIGKMIIWKDIEIKAGYYKKKKLCHVIYINGEGIEFNRRKDYRQYIGVEGKAEHFGADKVSVIVRDVSNNGIGLIVDNVAGFDNGRRMIVYFTDENGKYRFSLECKQVRSRVMQNGRVEVGCVVVNPPQALSQYVAFKQLAEKRRMLGE
ncbi:MAG: PilZ domain-containing protein [Lachnospiraceae bacterium]|nr:PilZ domain-containing protein [Lachnospiraceae bacterium]